MRAIGIDPAFANMGFALVEINVHGDSIIVQCVGIHLASTTKESGKSVRVSSDRLRRAQELHAYTQRIVKEWDAKMVFAEVPNGYTQSAAAGYGLGIAVGVLASIQVPIIEVSPMEVKRAVAGDAKGSPSKAQIIEWASKRWPNAGWARAEHKARTKKGMLPAGRLLADNEHCADALAAVAAGIATPEFKRALLFIQPDMNHEAARTPRQRLASHRVRLD